MATDKVRFSSAGESLFISGGGHQIQVSLSGVATPAETLAVAAQMEALLAPFMARQEEQRRKEEVESARRSLRSAEERLAELEGRDAEREAGAVEHHRYGTRWVPHPMDDGDRVDQRREGAPSPAPGEPFRRQIPMYCGAVIELADGTRTGDFTDFETNSGGTLMLRLDADEVALRHVTVEVSEEPLPDGDVAPLVSFSTSPDERDWRTMGYGNPANKVSRLHFYLHPSRPIPRVIYVRVEPRDEKDSREGFRDPVGADDAR